MAGLENARERKIAVLSDEATNIRGIRLNIGVTCSHEVGARI
jgi:hypothetical protein